MSVTRDRYNEVYTQGEAFLKKMTPKGVDIEKYFLGDQRNYKTLTNSYSFL